MMNVTVVGVALQEKGVGVLPQKMFALMYMPFGEFLCILAQKPVVKFVSIFLYKRTQSQMI